MILHLTFLTSSTLTAERVVVPAIAVSIPYPVILAPCAGAGTGDTNGRREDDDTEEA